MRLQWKLKGNLGSGTGLACHGTISLQRTHPSIHVVEAIATEVGGRIKPAAIVADLNA